jgi:tetratricopeptide (TPR) repeat protein
MADVDEHEHHDHEHHHDHDHDHDRPMSVEEAVRSLLLLGQVAMDKGDHESAVEAYRSALALEQNETALYNLASLYARGLGVRQDFVEAARLFHQAELLGNERAGKLCAKCMLDYVDDDLDGKTPADVYAKMAFFASKVYPEATDHVLEVNQGLLAIGGTYLAKGAYASSAKAFRAAAEFGHDQNAARYLAELSRAGVVPEDLA